ncbi:MAG: type II secretion system protein [Opitutaceae bacterium]|jgi:type IV pilus assembly protein PilA
MALPIRRRACRFCGFTLLEIIVVVTIIGLLAAIAIPAYQKLKQRSANTAVNNDLRVASGALEYYVLDKGSWPPDGAGGWPNELIGYLPPPDRWNLPTPIGGTWSWAINTDNTLASLRINNFTATPSQVADLDKMNDDGDLTTGKLFTSGQSLIYVLEK